MYRPAIRLFDGPDGKTRNLFKFFLRDDEISSIRLQLRAYAVNMMAANIRPTLELIDVIKEFDRLSKQFNKAHEETGA